MELGDIFHYLNVIRDVAKVVETDDPELTQHLSYIVGIVEGHTSAALEAGTITEDATKGVGDVVQAVKDAAPSSSSPSSSPEQAAPISTGAETDAPTTDGEVGLGDSHVEAQGQDQQQNQG